MFYTANVLENRRGTYWQLVLLTMFACHLDWQSVRSTSLTLQKCQRYRSHAQQDCHIFGHVVLTNSGIFLSGLPRPSRDDIRWQDDWQILLFDRGLSTAMLTVNHGNRQLLITLARHTPITQAILIFFLASCFKFTSMAANACAKSKPSNSPELTKILRSV